MDVDKVMEAFHDAMEWLKQHYGDYTFYRERDLVWLIQTQMTGDPRLAYPNRVYNDYTVLLNGKKKSVDLVVVDQSTGTVRLALEFKYEPDHARSEHDGDIPKGKIEPSVASWVDVLKDVDWVRSAVASGISEIGAAILIDEGGYRLQKQGKRQFDPDQYHDAWDCGGRRPRQIHIIAAVFECEISL